MVHTVSRAQWVTNGRDDEMSGRGMGGTGRAGQPDKAHPYETGPPEQWTKC